MTVEENRLYEAAISRAEKAEAEVARLRMALERISKLPNWAVEPHTAANWAIDIARAALECPTSISEDTERLDALQSLAEGGVFALVLHDGSANCHNYSGLAFGSGRVKRTLRQAIDHYRGK